MRVGVLLDGDGLAGWQAEALRRLPGGTEFVLYSCSNSRRRLSPVKHFVYYALNAWSLRIADTRSAPFPPELKVAGSIRFSSEWEGAWQKLPASLLQRVAADRPAALIKFGLGLMRVPPEEELSLPILSYHHGDPRRCRGRPAGLWEISEGVPVIGQIVQRLSNRLDAGAVLAFAETKVHRHSWRATLGGAYRISPLLLAPALERALQGSPLDIQPTGRNYRLPSNGKALAIAAGMIGQTIRRWLYGAVVEKGWTVATAPATGQRVELPPPAEWERIATPPGSRFLADPFPHPEHGILAESLRTRDGVGEIVHLALCQASPLISGPAHLSYPSTFSWRGERYCVPEVVDWSSVRLYRLGDQAEDLGPLDLPGRPRLLDPTPFVHDGRFYLFGNVAEEGPAVLRLWHSDDPHGKLFEHPASPLLISPAGARMGGAIMEVDGELVRVGQDGQEDYGNGLLLFSVKELTPERYREEPAGALRLTGWRGPHTLNRMGDRWLFDFYRDRFAPLAGYRRLRARLSRRG